MLVGSSRKCEWLAFVLQLERSNMQSNPHLVIGLVLIFVALLGGLPFLSMKTDKVRNVGHGVMCVAVLLGTYFVVVGVHEKNAAAQRNPPEFSQDAQIVQKLLRGENILLESYRDIPAIVTTAREELKLPPDVLEKLGDNRNYTIRFNASYKIPATNR